MGNLRKALDELKFDTRMRDWNENQGLVTRDEYNQHVEALPDLASRAVELKLEEESNGADSLDSYATSASVPAATKTEPSGNEGGGMDPMGGGGMDPSTH